MRGKYVNSTVRAILVLGVLGIVLAGCAGSAAAAPETAWWGISSALRPTYAAPGTKANIVVDLYNLGDTALTGVNSPVVITDTLPAGMTATSAEGWSGFNFVSEDFDGGVTCELTATVTCTWYGEKPLQPFEVIEVEIGVDVGPEAVSGVNQVAVAGGRVNACVSVAGTGQFRTPACDGRPSGQGESEAHDGAWEAHEEAAVPSVSRSFPVNVAPGETPFGVSEYGLNPETDEGTSDTRAGSHPFQLTTSLALNEGKSVAQPPALVKNLHLVLPPGLIGNATVMPKCTGAQFSTATRENTNLCPSDTAVGVAAVRATLHLGLQAEPRTGVFPVPIFNLEPAEGEPARFGFELEQVPVTIDTRVRTGADYAVEAIVSNATTAGVLQSSVVTLWGTPDDHRHDSARGWECIIAHHYAQGPLCASTSQPEPPAFLTLPTSCTGELRSSVLAESWTGEISAQPLVQDPLPSLDGCNQIPFDPSISVAPDRLEASSPEGLSIDVHVPQEAGSNTEGVAESDVKDTVVTLPEGVTVNPASAGGLEACSESQVGYLASQSSEADQRFSPEEASCPSGSKIATARIRIPVLAQPLEGGLYLATQEANPFHSLVAVYLVAKDPVSGVLVKLAGRTSLNETTGQITTSFVDTPQAPVEDIEIHTLGGARSALSTPDRALSAPGHCGPAVTNALFTPWSGNEPIGAQSSFDIGTGTCPAVLPFAPTLTAGTDQPYAAGFAPLTTEIGREDGEQAFASAQIRMPEGVSGVLKGVRLCGEAEADTGTCGSESLIGESSVSVGVGTEPFTVRGGRVYLTGPYRGAPFGLSVVTQAIAGPFNLGAVVVRARLEVDPRTAQITVTTDSGGPYGIPRILKGIPAQLKRLVVTINRPGFTFNPTNCLPMTVTGSATGAEGTTSAFHAPFQVANCAALKFTPKLTATVSGHGSKRAGVSFTTKLSYPAGALGKQANVSRVKVDLPVQLPTQGKTLEQACLAATFEADPAHCPSASVVGHANVTTPLLPVPLLGPAYFVSHGGEAFPSLTMVLQGYGITLELVGSTFIHHGITSTTFKATPDVPFSSFELTLPRGQYAALTAYLPKRHSYNLCGLHLAMPTALVAQSGLEIHEATAIKVSGCGRVSRKAAKRRR